MSHIEENNTALASEWVIPFWLKAFVFVALVGDLWILIRSVTSSATELFGISLPIITGVALPLLLLLVFVVFWFVCFPTSRYSLTCYWLLRFLREQITVLSLFGMLYLLVVRDPILSVRGGLVWLTLLSLLLVSLLLKPASLQEMPVYETLRVWNPGRKVLYASRRIPAWVPPLVISLIPIGLALFLIYFVLGSGLFHYGPYSLNNDEVSYWIWLRSYHEVGFKSGYNMPNELLPVFEFSRYGEQSPIYLYLYGFLTQWSNWFPALPVLVNFLLLTASIFVLLRSLRLTLEQSVLAICAIVLTWPVLLNLPATTHETLNQVIAILLAIMIAKLLIDREELSLVSRVGIVLFVCFATLVRYSWGLVLVPVLFYCLNGTLAKRIVLGTLLGGGLLLSAVVLTGYLTPPINDTVSVTLQDAALRGPGVFLENIYLQFSLMFRTRPLSPNLGTLFQMAVVVGWGVVSLADAVRIKRANLHAVLHSVEAFNIYHMFFLGLAGLIFYAYKNFQRTFAPALLIFYFLQVKRKDYKPLTALLLVSIFLFPVATTYEFVKSDYTGGIPQNLALQRQVGEFVVYDSEASNPWCNTLLIPLHFYDSRLMFVSPGIGIAYILTKSFETPFKSKYALFDSATYEAYKDRTHLKRLVSLPIGDLYQNQDADCPGMY